MLTQQVSLPQKNIRHFLPESVHIDSWQVLESFFENLKSRTISSGNDLQQWLSDYSELNEAVQEHAGWLYIRILEMLGLATVKHNAELYGGSVSVHSELGKGARFVLLFPARTLIKLENLS